MTRDGNPPGAEPVLAVTPGEPAGIGPECLVRMAEQRAKLRLLAVADPDLLNRTAEQLGASVRFAPWRAGDAVRPGQPACLAVPLAAPAVAGRPDPVNAAYVLDCLRCAVARIRAGDAAALVTGPVHKAVINDAGIAFTGHTEFLAALAEVPRVVMMLAADPLRVALVTTHLPLREVADAVTRDAVAATIRITASALADRFGIPSPVISVLGLNPHAGEGGHLGNEDAERILPAIEECRRDGMQLRGPLPADTAFTPAALAGCDAVVAMYHDQGLPVLKALGFGRAVNITLGLPFIRTSVDHGTALDIAGQGRADPASLLAAAHAARDLAARSAPEG